MVESYKDLNRILEIAIEIVPNGFGEYKTFDAPTLSFYWRSVSHFKAIVLLLENSLCIEAMSLSRALFSDSMELLQIAEVDDNRPALTLNWVNQSYEEIKGLFHKAKQLGIDSDASEMISYFDQKQSDIQNYMKRLRLDKLEKFRPESDAALRYKRKYDYWIYLLAHEMVHGGEASFIYQREKLADGSYAMFTQINNPKLINDVSKFAGRSMLDGVKSISQIFKWDLPETYNEIRLKFELSNNVNEEK